MEVSMATLRQRTDHVVTALGPPQIPDQECAIDLFSKNRPAEAGHHQRVNKESSTWVNQR
jgi:hypothetical protein